MYDSPACNRENVTKFITFLEIIKSSLDISRYFFTVTKNVNDYETERKLTRWCSQKAQKESAFPRKHFL